MSIHIVFRSGSIKNFGYQRKRYTYTIIDTAFRNVVTVTVVSAPNVCTSSKTTFTPR